MPSLAQNKLPVKTDDYSREDQWLLQKGNES